MSNDNNKNNVTSIHGDEFLEKLLQGEPIQSVVETCRLLLKLAEDGDISGLTAITVDNEYLCQGYIAGSPYYNPYPVIGAMELIKMDLLYHMVGEMEMLDVGQDDEPEE